MTGKLTGKTSLRKAKRLPHPTRVAAVAALALRPARGPSPFATPMAARFVSAKAVGAFIPGLTKKAFEKFGFSAATLITDWPQIVGAMIASYTEPQRLKWPRLAGAAEAAGEDATGRPGATLILRVDPARALDVEYNARQIRERINAYFGYAAVADIRLIQAPLERQNQPPPAPAPAKKARATEPLAADDPLAKALARLEQGVRNSPKRPG